MPSHQPMLLGNLAKTPNVPTPQLQERHLIYSSKTSSRFAAAACLTARSGCTKEASGKSQPSCVASRNGRHTATSTCGTFKATLPHRQTSKCATSVNFSRPSTTPSHLLVPSFISNDFRRGNAIARSCGLNNGPSNEPCRHCEAHHRDDQASHSRYGPPSSCILPLSPQSPH